VFVKILRVSDDNETTWSLKDDSVRSQQTMIQTVNRVALYLDAMKYLDVVSRADLSQLYIRPNSPLAAALIFLETVSQAAT
jgi:hypothetical protein